MATSTSSRWLPVALAASLLAGALVAVAIGITNAATGPPSSFVPIVPCRLVDTRPASQVGNRGSPIGANSTVTFAVRGTNGRCSIPANAVGIASNVAAIGPTARSFLTVYPADVPRPAGSNLNYLAGSPPTNNHVTVALSNTGAIKVYNRAGKVHLTIDVAGYYVPAQTAPPPSLPRLIEAIQNGQSLMPACGGCYNFAGSLNLPPGRWLVSYTVTVVNFTDFTDFFRCGLLHDPGELQGATTAFLRPGDVQPRHGEEAITVTATPNERIRIACRHDFNFGDGTGLMDATKMETGVISALEVAP